MKLARVGKVPKVLITGGGGQLGPGLATLLRKEFGTENVILSDIKKPNNYAANAGISHVFYTCILILKKILGPWRYANVSDKTVIEQIIVEENVDWVVGYFIKKKFKKKFFFKKIFFLGKLCSAFISDF